MAKLNQHPLAPHYMIDGIWIENIFWLHSCPEVNHYGLLYTNPCPYVSLYLAAIKCFTYLPTYIGSLGWKYEGKLPSWNFGESI